MSDAEAPRSSLVLYFSEDGRARIQCRLDGDTLWLTQAQIAELFQTTPQNITLHLRAVYREGEVDEGATCKPYLQVRTEGSRPVSRRLLHYSLPAVLAVGYRVRSPRGTQFRQWATATLAEYVVKGFALDDDRLKHPPAVDVPDYFDELLERIRDIRASERRMYTRVRDILKLAADYTPTDADTQKVFQVIQNKLHHAVTGMTAAETIAARADAAQPNMGLTTWRGGTVQKADVTVAKNYLNEQEIAELNRIVVMFLDFAEDQARRKQQVFLRDWQQKLDEFLRFNERDVLPNAGSVSRKQADDRAAAEYEAFAARRRAAAELQGEADAFQALEGAAERLPKRTKGTPAKGGDE
jgi:hypothetical protein